MLKFKLNKQFLWSSLSFLVVLFILFVVVFRVETAHGATVLDENFDSYTAGSVAGQGGWYSGASNVTTAQSLSAPNSLTNGGAGTAIKQFATTTDMYIEFDFRVNNSGGANQSLVFTDITNSLGFSVDYSVLFGFRYNASASVAPVTDSVWTNARINAVHNGTNYDLDIYIDDILEYSTTFGSTSTIPFDTIRVITSSSNLRWVDNITIDSTDPTPTSGITSITSPVDSTIYPFNPITFSGTYNQLDTYNYIVGDLTKISSPQQNVYFEPIPLPPVTNTGLSFSVNKSLTLTGEYTFRARLYDSVNNLYTPWTSTTTFALGGTTTIPIEDYGIASSTFATSTFVDSGNFLSYINVPQLLSTKAPFGYFFQVYSIITTTISNPPAASTFPAGTFEVQIPNQPTTTVEMFSTTTVSYFLTPSSISLIRAVLVAITYLVTAISIYTIVRHSHLL